MINTSRIINSIPIKFLSRLYIHIITYYPRKKNITLALDPCLKNLNQDDGRD